MMPDKIVELPSGEVVAFPEGMSDEDINSAIREFLIGRQAEQNAQRLAPPPPDRLQAPGPGAGLSDVMAWRQGAMGDLGRAEPQSPQETGMAAAGAGLAAGVGGMAATAPVTAAGLGASTAGLTASVVLGDYIEKKLGLPFWAGEAFALLVQKKPRSKAMKLLKGVFGRASKGAPKAGAEGARKAIVREVVEDMTSSPTMGTTSKTAAPQGGLPARATLTEIPKAPKRPGIPRMAGGSKAQRAWMESQGLVPGAMGPDDVLAMKARGATRDEIEAALLRAGRTTKTGHIGTTPSPEVGLKPKNWKPAGAAPTSKPSTVKGPKIQGGTAGEGSLADIVDSVKKWHGVQKLSKPQIESALREVYGFPKKDARELILLVL